VASIATGDRAHVVTLTNDNRQAWVANIGDNTISIVDTTTFRILGTIAVGKGPTGLTFSRDGRFAYVSNQGDKTVEVIDTASHRVLKAIPVGTNPHFLVLGPDGRIWGTNTGGTDIYIIDPAAQDKIASINVGPGPQQIAFGYKGLQGPNAYVTVAGLNRVVVVSADPRNLRILEQIDVGQRPNGISGNREGTRLFVVHEVSNDLKVIGSRRWRREATAASAEDQVERDTDEGQPDQDPERGHPLAFHRPPASGAPARQAQGREHHHHEARDQEDRVEEVGSLFHLALVSRRAAPQRDGLPAAGRPRSRMASIRALRSSSSASKTVSRWSADLTT
jgi:YVTN family beta-propeller protein